MPYVRRLIWDAENEPHIARHGVSRREVEEVCRSEHVTGVGKKGRSLIFGRTLRGRLLAVVLDTYSSQPGIYYPVTARAINRKERAIYARQIGGGAR